MSAPLHDVAYDDGDAFYAYGRPGYCSRCHQPDAECDCCADCHEHADDCMCADEPLMPAHNRDEDCTVGDDDFCTGCGVHHGDPCDCCGGRGFHRDGCAESDETIGATVPCVVCNVARVVVGEGYCDDDGPKCDACVAQKRLCLEIPACLVIGTPASK